MQSSNNRNYVSLTGNIGKHINLKETKSGHVLNFSMATNEVIGKGESKKQITDWHNCVAWADLAKSMADCLKTGQQVQIKGSLRSNNYINDKGELVYSSQIKIATFDILHSKVTAPTEAEPAAPIQVAEPVKGSKAAPKKATKSKQK